MSWVQVVMAIPLGLLAMALFHDFMAGLADERIWGRPIQPPGRPGPNPSQRAGGHDLVEPQPQLKRAG